MQVTRLSPLDIPQRTKQVSQVVMQKRDEPRAESASVCDRVKPASCISQTHIVPSEQASVEPQASVTYEEQEPIAQKDEKLSANHPISVYRAPVLRRFITATAQGHTEQLPVGYSASCATAPLKVFYPNSNKSKWFMSRSVSCTQFDLEMELPIGALVTIDADNFMLISGDENKRFAGVADMSSDYIDLFFYENEIVLPDGMTCTQLYSEGGFRMLVQDESSSNVQVQVEGGHVYCNLTPCKVTEMLGTTKCVVARFSHSNSNLPYFCDCDHIVSIEPDHTGHSHIALNTARLFHKKYCGVASRFELPKVFTVINSIKTSTRVLLSFSNAPHMKRELYARQRNDMDFKLYDLDSFEYAKQVGSLVLESEDGKPFNVEVFHSEPIEGFSMEESLEQQNGIYMDKWTGNNATVWTAGTCQSIALNCSKEGVVMFKRKIRNDLVQENKQKIKEIMFSDLSEAHNGSSDKIDRLLIEITEAERMIQSELKATAKYSFWGDTDELLKEQVEKMGDVVAHCPRPRSGFGVYCDEHEDTKLTQQKMRLSTNDYVQFLRDLYHDRAKEWNLVDKEKYHAKSEKEHREYGRCQKELGCRLPKTRYSPPESIASPKESSIASETHVVEVQKSALTPKMKSIVKDREPEGAFDGTYYFVFDKNQVCLGFVRCPTDTVFVTAPKNTKDLSIFCIAFASCSVNICSVVQKHFLETRNY